jgi:hypothetical protein
MTKLNQIQNALLELDGGKFQKLADSYIYKKGYEWINSPGSVTGSDKVRKGTPDTFFRLPNGKYVFVEYTTQQTGVFNKVMNDLNKCLDVMKTGVPIEEIIFCHTTTLSATEEHDLGIECMKYGININIFGIDKISQDLYHKYPILARDFLNIEVDTGQIVPPDDFISAYGRSKLATRLNTKFLFRETEIEQTLQDLENSDLVIVSGRPGIGKSRFALECCKRFKDAHPDYDFQCIYNRGQDLYEDLRVYFSEPGSFLILVDDANRVSRFDYIVQLLQGKREDQRIKVIVTVRDYALDGIRDSASSQGDAPIMELKPLEDSQIKQLVKDEFVILNPLYLDRIADISKGNPRLAMMAAEVAKRENKFESIIDVTVLYDQYFASIRRDLQELGDKNLLKVAGIVAFFRSIDYSNKEIMASIEDAFEMPSGAFWETAQRLHDLEIFDMYENEVVKTSDQILATYLFYLAFFKERVLDFSILLEHFFPKHSHRLVDAINPVLNTFNLDEVKGAMREPVDKAWKSLEERNDKDGLLHLLEVFWFLLPTETLLYVKGQIDEMESKEFDLSRMEFKENSWIPSPSILDILGSFKYGNDADFRIALELLLEYIAKRPDELPQVLFLLTDRFGFNHRSYLRGFIIQQEVIDELWTYTNNGQNDIYSRIFLAVAEKYLHIKFHTTELKESHSFNMIKFHLPPTSELIQLRQIIWNRVFLLYKISALRKTVLNVLHNYCISNRADSVRDVITQDAKEVLPFMNTELDPDSFCHCYAVHEYLDLLGCQSILFDKGMESKFTNEAYTLSTLLLQKNLERKNLGLGHDMYKLLKRKQIDENFKNFDLSDYKTFLNMCQEIYIEMVQERMDYQIQRETIRILLALADREPDIYINVLEYYLKLGDPLNLISLPESPRLIEKLVKIYKAERSYEILRLLDPTMRPWLFCYYAALPASEISKDQLRQLYSLYQEAEGSSLPRCLDFLLKYRSLDEAVVVRVTEIILEKVNTEPNFAYALESLFKEYTDVNKEVIDIFAENKYLLKRAYLAVLKIEDYADYDGKTFERILDLDQDFISEYIDHVYKIEDMPGLPDDTRDFTFLWMRDDYEKVIERAVNQTFRNELGQDAFRYTYTYLNVFFTQQNNDKKYDVVRERQNRFLNALIRQNYNNPDMMRFIFGVIANFATERRRQFVALFLEYNKCFEDFERLALEPNSMGWSGSAVPMLEKRVDYFESLLQHLNDVKLLQHRQHVERIIQRYQRDIEREKKKDFIGD